jgi:osmoprotectant transport system permease protein
MKALTFLTLFILGGTALAQDKPVIRVASKTFTESYILAELIAQTIEKTGEARVERKMGLGATGISHAALINGEIDIYPEYTGTIAEVILKNKSITTVVGINERLLLDGLMISEGFGFNNTYAMALAEDTYKKRGITKVSELVNHTDIAGGFTHEFIKRNDGLGELEKFYGFKLQNVTSMEHALAYEAIQQNKIDMMEVYTTDAKIKKYGLKILQDDKNYFPRYEGVLYARREFKEKFPKTWKALNDVLVGQIDNERMVSLNAAVELEKKTFAGAAAIFFGDKTYMKKSIYPEIFRLTAEHLQIVFISLFFSILIGIPLGVLSARNKIVGQIFLTGSGLLQTVPSLALLCFLIPLVGIGEMPAYIALFLYGLLPIVRNTYTGISSINAKILESSELMGLTQFQQLRIVQLPLASINIMAGIKTSAVMNVGMATLAAFIGAGGLGNLIVTGLNLNDNEIILRGAIPAAILAILMDFLFGLVDKVAIPKGIR